MTFCEKNQYLGSAVRYYHVNVVVGESHVNQSKGELNRVRSRLRRILHLMTILSSESGFTADDLIKMFGVSRRTLFRDLEELKNIGVPYYWDKSDRCYKIPPEFSLPLLRLSLQEASGLLLFAHIAKSCSNFPFKSSMLRAVCSPKTVPVKVRV